MNVETELINFNKKIYFALLLSGPKSNHTEHYYSNEFDSY